MKKIREIARLHEITKLSQRQIASALNISRPVVSRTIAAIKQADLTYEIMLKMPDTEVSEFFTEGKEPSSKSQELRRLCPYIAKELKKTGVTLKHLWEEYLEKDPQGLKYTQFCFHFQQWRQDEKLSMHIEHKAGDKMSIDYTGKKMVITDRKTGKTKEVEIFVAILPASQLTYAEASDNQNKESFVRSTERALHYMGGVPTALVPDNLKSGVLKASIYDPDQKSNTTHCLIINLLERVWLPHK